MSDDGSENGVSGWADAIEGVLRRRAEQLRAMGRGEDAALVAGWADLHAQRLRAVDGSGSPDQD